MLSFFNIIVCNETQNISNKKTLNFESTSKQLRSQIDTTSINLYGELNFIIIHTSNKTTITQARGRYRSNLENLYLHSVDECGIVVPPQYLNRHLYKQDYDELRAAIGLMDPNDSKRLLPKNRLKQLLEANGYTVTENLRNRKGRYRTIEKREDM